MERLTIDDMIKALRCVASQDTEGDCYKDHENFKHMKDDKYKRIVCGTGENLKDWISGRDAVGCPYHQKTYGTCYEDGELYWLKDVAELLEELKSYKDIGTPKELKELKENGAFTGVELAKLAIMQKELKKYKDSEEQGLLVRLPFPIGTTVWDICGMDIRENVVSGLEYDKGGKWFLWANEDEWLGELNASVFLTREEAEKKLEEMKNEI